MIQKDLTPREIVERREVTQRGLRSGRGWGMVYLWVESHKRMSRAPDREASEEGERDRPILLGPYFPQRQILV